MRWIKMFEEFSGDEIDQVMMSICDDQGLSFRLIEEYSGYRILTDDIRVYSVDGRPGVDARRYEEYLGDGWRIRQVSMDTAWDDFGDAIAESIVDAVVFVKGNPADVTLAWLKEVYGGLKPIKTEVNPRKSGEPPRGVNYKYVDGERRVFSFTVAEGERGPFDLESGNSKFIDVDYKLRDFIVFLGVDVDGCRKVIESWMREVYGLNGLPFFK